MNKRIRQYLGILFAILGYYLIHEGAHLLYALSINTFKQISFLGLGIQIEVYTETMTVHQLALFCLLGSISTILTSYILIMYSNKICRSTSKVFKACMYYLTTVLLFNDPLYLSILYKMFGGGDMNGISLVIDENVARMGYGILLLLHIFVFLKVVYPRYTKAFKADK